ncbi:MAG: DegV family protein [Clostridia bacterium]|nr:DegV family protein [Clostridia bacterium]
MIKIIVDSSADCNVQDGIVDAIVPISINIDGAEYKSGVNLTSDKFYELLQNAKEFPRTAQPSPQSFVDIFEQAQENGDQIIYLCLSSHFSGTYQGALIAKDMVDYDDIHVVDSIGVTHMITILAKYARKLINEGLTAGEIVDKCEELKTKIKIYAGVDTLEYLYKGGRLSRASAAVGGIAGIKPIIAVQEGKVEVVAKSIGNLRAMNTLLEKLKSHTLNPDFPLYSMYTSGTENCETLEQKLADNGYTVEGRLQIGSTIGAHVGPGVYAVLFVEQ